MDTRRRWSARLLLSVFLPIVLLSSLHVHTYEPAGTGDCYECRHDVPHAGHFTSGTASLHGCLLCQFLTLAFVAGNVAAAISVATVANCGQQQPTAACVAGIGGSHDSRAPPFHSSHLVF